MLDIQEIRRHPKQIQENFDRRGINISVKEILQLDERRRKFQTELQELRFRKNQMSKEVSSRKKRGEAADDLLRSIRSLGIKINDLNYSLQLETEQLQKCLNRFPNLLDQDVEGERRILCQFGKRQVFSFQPLDHMELCRRHRLIDYETAGSLMGSGYCIYQGFGAKLEWALLNFCLEENQKAGYEMLMFPPVAGENCGFGAGQFPKFREEVYNVQGTGQFLVPTAETILVNLHQNEIIKDTQLPLKYTAYTPCFRREISKKRDEKGIVRGHSFNKVEMVQFTSKEQSDEAFASLLGQAENLMKQLGLHYRVVKLSAGECSAAMARTYDIEVWLPAEQQYKEVSSVSNARTYQARRSNTRYKDPTGRIHYVHTVNGSGLATSRLFAAILEQNQREDGSIRIPEALTERIGCEMIPVPGRRKDV